MKPLQVWLPAFDPMVSSPARKRDLQRAQRSWRGETTVWLLPDLKAEARWQTPGCPFSFELAVPSETFDRIDIHHVGKNGGLFGNYLRFPARTLGDFLGAWLNLRNRPEGLGINYYLVPEEIPFIAPTIEGDTAVYRLGWIKVGPANFIPLEISPDRRFQFSWPPPGVPFETVSPSSESLEAAGPLEHAGHLQLDETHRYSTFARRDAPEERATIFVDRWPEPFTQLFPHGGGPDAGLCLVKASEVACLSQSDPEDALRKAQNYSAGSTCQGTSLVRDSWLYTLIQESEEADVLAQIELSHGLCFSSFQESEVSQEFHEKMSSVVPIRRAIGVQGLLWSLLIEKLEDGLRFLPCKHCGRIIEQRKSRKFCGRETNPECFGTRRASDKRRERNGSKRKKRSASSR